MPDGVIRYPRYRFPPAIISHAVWLYYRFTLSFGDVEDLLALRGITVSYETVRRWCQTFGLAYARRLRRQRSPAVFRASSATWASTLMGAQIMARAGYDPREMANMFKTTIQAEGGRSGPEWLSSHPDPGNRYNAIVQEASMLRVEGNANSGQFQSIKSRLAGMSPAYTAEQIAKGQAKTDGRTVGTGGRRVVNVEPPLNAYRTHQPSDFLRIGVPANWDEADASAGGVTYAPDGGFVQRDNGGSAFTHGVQVGVAQGAGATCSRRNSR